MKEFNEFQNFASLTVGGFVEAVVTKDDSIFEDVGRLIPALGASAAGITGADLMGSEVRAAGKEEFDESELISYNNLRSLPEPYRTLVAKQLVSLTGLIAQAIGAKENEQ